MTNDPDQPPVPTCFNCKTDPVAIGDLCKACIRRIEVVFEKSQTGRRECPHCMGCCYVPSEKVPETICPRCLGFGHI